MTQSGNADPPVGLETRNIFFDTEVFRSSDHNLNANLLWFFGCYMDEAVFDFHTTDVTLREVARQLLAREREVTARANSAAKKLRRWNSRYRREQDRLPVPDLLSEPTEPGAAYREFESIVRHEWGAREHRAADLLAGPVIDRYFASEPPGLAADAVRVSLYSGTSRPPLPSRPLPAFVPILQPHPRTQQSTTFHVVGVVDADARP